MTQGFHHGSTPRILDIRNRKNCRDVKRYKEEDENYGSKNRLSEVCGYDPRDSQYYFFTL